MMAEIDHPGPSKLIAFGLIAITLRRSMVASCSRKTNAVRPNTGPGLSLRFPPADPAGTNPVHSKAAACLPSRATVVSRLMRHQYRQVCVLHDVAGGAAENNLPQPTPCEGALDQ